jgi:Mg-chelatase subunit ChlD
VVVSITPPAAPVIQNVLDDVGVAHFMQKGEVTDDDKPTIIGTAQADSIVKVYDGVLLLGSAQADASGQWSFTPTEALKDGSHDITATATNLIGQTSDATGIWNFVVDSQAPDAVSDLVVTDDVGARTGPLVDGDTTDDATPTFTGKAEPDSTVSVYDNGTRIGEAVADENGDWSFTPSKPLPDGDHAFTTVVTDPAGNVGAPSTPVNVAIDTADVTVSIGTLVDDQGAIKGDIAPNGVTDDVRPEIQGTGKAGSTITVYDGAMELGTTQVRRDGTWSFTPEADLGEGEHSITATATDKAGTVSEPTAPFDFSVDTQSPQAPTIGAAQDDVGAITGPLADGDTTDDPTPTLSGKAEPGSTVSVYDNGELLGTVSADKDGGWSYTPTTPLPEGEHEFKVTATDRAGNVSDESDPITLITDYTAPDASKLAITGVEDDVGGVTGNVPAGATTDDNRPVISGTGTTGDTIIVMVKDSLGSRELGRTTIDEDGNWSLPVTTPLTSGDNEFTATEMDLAGNSTESAPYAVNVIGGKPPVPVIVNVQDDVGAVHFLEKGEVTDDAKPTIIGTAEKGSIVKIYDGGTSLGSVQADEHGQWSFTPSDALKDGAHDITATATDAIGRTSDATGIWNFVVDTRAPDAASDLVVTDDVGARTGPLADGDTTDDATPTFSGTAEPGGTVSVYDNGVKIGDAVADETTGDWSFTPSKALPDGDHAFKTVVTDPAGNASAPSAPVNVTIDTKDVTVSIDALADDQGAITGDIAPNGVTDDLRPEVKGQGKAGSTITVYDGTTELGTTEVKPDGTWSFTPSTDLGQGAHSITATATEKSGNISAPTAPFNFSVDSEKPTVRTIDAAQDDVGAIQQSLHDGDTTDDPTPTLSGTAEPNSKVTVYDNGTPLGTANADKDGKWSFTPTTTLPEGEHEFTITATDKAGNASDKSAPFTLITDYTPPDATIDIIGISDDTGVPDDFITKDDQIIIHGRISRLLQPDERVQISSDGGKTWADVNVAARIWSSSQPLSQGDNTFDARIIDKAGNVGGTDSQVVTLDTTPPTQTASIVGYVDDEGSVAGDFDFSSHPTTDDASPLLKGTLSAGLATGDTVEIYRDGLLIGTAEVNDTDWTFQDDGLTGGTHVYTAKVVDIAGNAGNPSGAASLTYDSLLSLQANDTVVHEAALQGGTGKDWLANDSSNTGDLTASGTFSLGSSVTNITITLGGHSTGLTLADLASGKTITIGGDTLTITNLGNGEYGYTYTLGVPKSHDTSGGKVGEIVNNDFKITATGAGGTAEATGEIRIVNDEVTASPDDFVIDMPKVAEGVVLTLVLDSSPSMELLDGGTQSRWALAKQSLLNLLDKYAEAYPAGTSFEINLVAFDGVDSKWPNSIQSYTFNSIADAKAAIEARTVGYSGTYYDNALIEAQKLIQASRNKHPDYDQKVYFITDGEPEAGHGVPVSWSNFVTANQDALDVYGVGLGPAVNTPSASNEIKKALATGDPKDLFIPVVNAEDLSEALMDTLPTVDGNLFNQTANGKPESVALGADGGFTLSKVAFDGQDYVFGADGTVTIQVVTGLTMTIDDKGNYKIITSLASPNLKVPMIFTLTDADGDTSVVTEQLQFGDPSRPTLAALHETSNTVDDSSLDMLHSEDGIGIFFDARAGDELVGTAGNDTFKISAADFGHLDGGAGIDTLVMDAKDMHIDLSALGLQSIEKFDLGTGGNTLTLGAKEVLANGQTDLMLADGKTQMVVNGAFGDVDLLGGNTGPDGWASEGVTQVDGVTYNIYTNLAGTSELLVENKVHVTIL